MTRILAFVLALFAAGAALAQPRGEAVLYEGPEFNGRNYVLRGDLNNFEHIGFNDRTSSIYVVSGTWEFCTDAYFHGECRSYGPGEYRNLGRQGNRLSSARLVVTERPRGEGARGDVVLYDRRNFDGVLRALDGPTPNFEPLGMNDRVSSIVVRRGPWEFCTDANYRGTCHVYGPGEYAVLPSGQGNAYSSARPVQSIPPPPGRARIRLYDGADFSGRALWLDQTTPNLEHTGFNDRVNSIIVESGRWRLCTDANGRGACRELGPGRYPILPHELRSRISSVFLQ
jgi:hypothetical protein